MVQRTRAELKTQISTLLADNTSGNISAGDLRSICDDLADSSYVQDSDSSPLQNLVGGMVSGNFENNINVTYDGANGKLDFDADDTQLSNTQVQAIVGLMVAGNTEEGISVTYNPGTGKLNFVVGDTNPAVTAFSIQDEPVNVLPGTTISGTKTFLYSISNTANVVGNLTIRQDGAALSSAVNRDGSSISLAINSVTLTNAGDSTTFQISGLNNQSQTFSRDFTVTAAASSEFFYYGLSATNNPASIDTSTMQRRLSAAETFDFSVGPTSAGQFIILLAPQDHDLSTLINTGLNVDVLNTYTATTFVRTINGQLYNSYVFGPVNAGITQAYRATTN